MSAGGIYYHRWGDAPIRTIGVSLFVNESEVHQFTDVAYTHLPFIQRNATGLPSPHQTLFPRSGQMALCSANETHGHGGHGGHNATGNGSCITAISHTSAIIYTVSSGTEARDSGMAIPHGSGKSAAWM
jgi:hypothetical protein